MSGQSSQATLELVIFRVEGQRYALPLSGVERAVRAVAVSLLPDAPHAVSGVIDVAGRLVPVFDLRPRLRLPPRPLDPSQHFLLARTANRTIALIVDEVEAVIAQAAADVASMEPLIPELQHIQGVVRFEDGLVLIHDLDRFLSSQDEILLDAALRAGAA